MRPRQVSSTKGSFILIFVKKESSGLVLRGFFNSTVYFRLLKGPGKEFLARDSFTNLYNSEYSLQTDPVSSLYTRYR